MADIFKQFVRHLDGVNKAAVADAAGRAIAEHCDKRIAKAKRAITREEDRLLKACGPAPGSTGATRRLIKSAFANMRMALGEQPKRAFVSSHQRGGGT